MDRMVPQILVIIKALLITVFYWLYSRFWKMVHIRRPSCLDDGSHNICAHWHQDELCLIGPYIGSGMAIMASRSQDGELLKWILKFFGFRVVRGSSTRGGAAGLKGLVDMVIKEKCSASLAVDGPRGPVFRVKPGIIKLAQQTQRPLILGASSARRRFIFKQAWNQCYLPSPFTRCIIVYAGPLRIPQDLTKEMLEEWRVRVEKILLALKTEAEQYFERSFSVLSLKTNGV